MWGEGAEGRETDGSGGKKKGSTIVCCMQPGARTEKELGSLVPADLWLSRTALKLHTHKKKRDITQIGVEVHGEKCICLASAKLSSKLKKGLLQLSWSNITAKFFIFKSLEQGFRCLIMFFIVAVLGFHAFQTMKMNLQSSNLNNMNNPSA